MQGSICPVKDDLIIAVGVVILITTVKAVHVYI